MSHVAAVWRSVCGEIFPSFGNSPDSRTRLYGTVGFTCGEDAEPVVKLVGPHGSCTTLPGWTRTSGSILTCATRWK